MSQLDRFPFGVGPRRVFLTVALAVSMLGVVGTTNAPTASAAPQSTAGAVQVPPTDPTDVSVSGQDVLADEPGRIGEIAAANDVSVPEVRAILADPTAFVSEGDAIYFVEPPPDPRSLTPDPDQADAGAGVPYADTFKMHSKPGSSRTIFLDFDGHTISGTYWSPDDSGPFTAKPFDPDRTPGFSPSDLSKIQTVWQGVAEDFAPFDVDVTTEDPGLAKIRRDSDVDTVYGTRAVITETTDEEVIPGRSAGGVAYYDAFDAIGADHDGRQPAWAFASQFGPSMKALGEVVSHEVGHNLGLVHDGRTGIEEYYGGHGVWAPIMGNSYSQPVSHWSKGEYPGASSTEDDFVEMASHGVVARPDDHTNAFATATTLTSSVDGTVTTGSDQDLFKYVATASGSWNFRATPAPVAPNLDIKLTLLSAAGAQLAQSDPTVVELDSSTATGLDASITAPVTAGTTYYVRVEPTSHLTPATGYSTYGSIGAYTLSASNGPACSSQDVLEPNDSIDTASAARSGEAIASRVCRGNVDYYGIQALAGQTLSAALAFSHSEGDLNATLLDPTGASVATATSTANNESLNHVAATSGVYILEVYGQGGAAATYSLTMTSPMCPPDDAHENNDTPATAKAVTAGVVVNAISCPGDQDYYSFVVPASGDLEVELTHSQRFGPVTMQLLSATGAVLDEDLNWSESDDLRVRLFGGDAGIVRIRIIPGTTNALYAFTLFSEPTAPTAVTAVAGPGSATVSWTDPVGTGGQPISSYSVTAYAGGEAVGWEYGSAKPLTVDHLAPGVTHTFKVSASNQVGTSPESAPSAGVTPLAPLLPGAPTNVAGYAKDQAVDLTWTPPASDGGGQITAYVVTPYIGATAQPAQTFPDSYGAATVTGLTNGTAYTFKVAAKNVTGTGTQSAPSPAFTPLSVPGIPTGATAAAGYQSATVSWTAPAPNGSAPITGYEVTSFLDGEEWSSQTTDGPETSMVLDLWSGDSFAFRVAAINSSGTGARSALSNSVTPNDTPTAPRAPYSVNAYAGVGSATLYWNEPQANGSPITGYVVTPYIGASPQGAQTFNSLDTEQTVTGLTNGTTYTFRVAAKNAIGTGPKSPSSGAVTPSTVPGAPTGAAAVAGNTQATVSWTAPASNGGSPVTNYVVTAFIGAAEDTTVYSIGTGTSAVVTGLTNGTSYTFKVAASNNNGEGARSAASNAVTPNVTPTVPGVPTGVSGVAGNAQVVVSWTAPGSTGGSALTGYVVTPYIGGSAQSARVFASTATSQTVTGLTNGTAYTFKVAAKNVVGTGAQSSASSAVTPSAVVIPFAPFASWSALVTRQYIDLTTKAPTASELNTWVSQLTARTKTKGDLDDSLRRGTENLSNVDPVVRVYRAFLGRAPDAGGLQFWIRRRRNVAPAKTWSVTQIATDFTNSNEFKTKYGALTNREFVTRIYTDVLGRTADQSGVNYWTGKLDRKEKTKAQVMVGFSESNEYKTKQAQNTDVAVAYIYLMGRSPTAAEASDWVTRQKAGTTHATLLTELLTSAMYATRVTG